MEQLKSKSEIAAQATPAHGEAQSAATIIERTSKVRVEDVEDEF
ncbi:hypothetical protein ACQEV2_42365 [Streptomyces sp. CA-251387]